MGENVQKVKANKSLKSALKITRGDWDAAFFLFFAQYAIPVVVATPLLATGFPAWIIMFYLFPAFIWQQVLCEFYCTWMALRLATREKRIDVTALPGTGPDLVSTLAITFSVVMPTWMETHDAMLAWGLGVGCCLLFGVIKLIFIPFADWLRRQFASAALLGTIGGILLVFIGTIYGIGLFSQPYIAFICAAIIFLANWGRLKLPVSPIVLVIILGIILGVVTGAVPGIRAGFPGFYPGMPTLIGFQYVIPAFMKYASLIIPLAVGYQLMWTFSNIEAAAAVGDRYSVREILIADSLLTTIGGALLGSWMPTFVLTGHPGLKEMGARTSYPTLTALMYLITGISGLLWAGAGVVPAGAIAAIFVWLAVVMAEVAVVQSPKKHIPAVLITFIPAGAYLLQGQLSQAISALGVSIDAVSYTHLTLPTN